MRPDEHKKKKSAQYKKKHAISDKHGEKTKKSCNETLKKTLDGNSDGSNEVEEVVQTAKFSRRKLTSNWEKYEIKPEEDPYLGVERKGESFEKLLKSAGGSDSQFRFKDETFWGEDISDSIANQMTVDLVSLADSLSSLTLCQKFDLDKEHFTDDQVEVMNARQVQQTSDNIPVDVSRFSSPGEKVNSNPTQEKAMESGAVEPEILKTQPAINENDLDSLVSMVTTENSPNPTPLQKSEESADDLEDWLNSVLD